jgi:choline dehydrogenase-like flavoprotein
MTCVTMTKLKYDAIIIGTRQAGPPLAKRLSEAVSELIPTMLEELGSSAA